MFLSMYLLMFKKNIPKIPFRLIYLLIAFTQEDKCMIDFCETPNLENLIKVPMCFKNPINPSSIDVILTNRKIAFKIPWRKRQV